MNAPEDALIEILAEHEESHQIDGDYGELMWVECSCGADFEDLNGYGSGYRSHRAQVLAEWVAGEKARAWSEGATAIRNSDPSWWAVIVRENPYEVSGN